jgi:hypothetical protein
MARWYKIVLGGGTTFDATNNPTALQVEMDIAVSPTNAPNIGQGAWCRVWGIPLQTVLTANQFTDQTISVFGGMQRGLPLSNPNEQGLLVQGIVLPALGNWTGVNMYIDFYITPGTTGNATVSGAANLVHNWPANQPLSTAIKNALQTAFPGFTANINISPNLVRPNDERGFYQTLGQYATFLFNASHDIMKTAGYLGVQVSVQGNTITVSDGTQTQSAAKTINPWDLIGQPIWTGKQTAQWRTTMRGDFNVGDMATLPKSLAQLQPIGGGQVSGQGINIIQGSFRIQAIRHVGNFRNPDGSAWCTIFDGIQPMPRSGSSTAITNTATPSGRAVGPV